jgi:hypothetical protein
MAAYLDAVIRKDASVVDRHFHPRVESMLNGTPVPDPARPLPPISTECKPRFRGSLGTCIVTWRSPRSARVRLFPNGQTSRIAQPRSALSTLLQLRDFAMQMGMIWVGAGDLPGNNWSGGARSGLIRLGTWVGAMNQSNADEETPSIGDIETAERFARRGALICRRFRDGIPFETERMSEPEFRKRNLERRDAL